MIANADIRTGDALAVLKTLDDESVNCCVTSPPYWGLRDYGVDGQIGLEDTPEKFIERLVEVFREVRRVLRKDGTCWVNMGDGYVASPRGNKPGDLSTSSLTNPDRQDKLWGKHKYRGGEREGRVRPGGCLKPKDLIGQPWMLAFALRADGWHLRQDIIWHKPNPMPESVRDRCTKAHEYIFLLTKSARYWFDQEAVTEPVSPNTHMRLSQDVASQIGSDRAHAGGKTNGKMKAVGRKAKMGKVGREKHNASFDAAVCLPVDKRNKRSVWTITTRGYSEAHFATFPPKLIEPCILAGCPSKVCPKCGAPWVREVERTDEPDTSAKGSRFDAGETGDRDGGDRTQQGARFRKRAGGLVPTCECGRDPVAGNGSGTTGAVALQHDRNYIGIELNPEYVKLTHKRLKPVLGDALFGSPCTPPASAEGSSPRQLGTQNPEPGTRHP